MPKLGFTTNRGIGYHVSYRDPDTGVPRKHRFGMIEAHDAELAYHRWLARHLGGDNASSTAPKDAAPAFQFDELDDLKAAVAAAEAVIGLIERRESVAGFTHRMARIERELVE